MSSIHIDFDVRVVGEEELVPFDQVMALLRQLDEHTPNVDLDEIATSLEKQKENARTR